MQQSENQVQLNPIVNGSFNEELTNEQCLEFDFETKKSMAWNIIVSTEFAHSFRDVDPAVFTLVPPKYTHDMITPETVDNILVTARTEFQQRHKQLLRLTENYYYHQGQEIKKAQKKYGFSGFLKMDYRKLVGYIVAGGSWNDFEHFKVADAVKELEQLAPRFYMPNNPNNGSKDHYWTTNGEYITMKCEMINEAKLQQYMDFFATHFSPIGNRIKADSIRHETSDLGHGYHSLELIMWWD